MKREHLSQNAGFEVERGTEDNVSFLWNETDDRWTTNGKDLVLSTFIGNVTGQVSTLSNHDTDNPNRRKHKPLFHKC